MTVPFNTIYEDGGAPITGDGLNTFVQSCDNFATLRSFIGASGMQVSVLGQTAAGDGNGGAFYWSNASTAADDDFNVIVPSGAIGAWLRSSGPFDLTPGSASLSSLNPLYFGSYSQLSGVRDILNLSAALADSPNSFRDAFYSSISDSDLTVYAGSHTDYAGRFAAFGPAASGTFITGYKNYVGINAYAMAATSPAGSPFAFGVSGINADAFQYGGGVGSNEFAAHQPSGSLDQAASLAAVQSIIDNNFMDADDTHTAYAFLATNTGTRLATAAYGFSGAGSQKAFLQAGGAAVTEAAIVMPHSATANEGSIIDYGRWNGNPAGGSYSQWKRGTHDGEYSWVDGGIIIGRLDPYGWKVGTNDAPILTTAQHSFIYLTSCAGTPTGVPSTGTAGQTALVFDTTGKKLWAYDFLTSTWLGVVVA